MTLTESSSSVSLRLPFATLRPALIVSAVLAVLAMATVPVHDRLYTTIAEAVAGSSLASAAGFVAENGPYALVATVTVLAVRTWRRDRSAFVTLAVAGVGVITAYLSSELIKLLITEPRPCRALDVAVALDCPEIGDWSWPSNHSVIAASFATACVLAVPRTVWFVAPLAAMLAFSRVAGGVHYVHDVLSGLSLGVLVVSVVTAVLLPSAARVRWTGHVLRSAPGDDRAR